MLSAADTVALHGKVTRAIWLGGDRWAALAPNYGIVQLVDFGRKSVTVLGAADSSTLRNPSIIFSAADTLYVSDWGLRRTTAWDRDDNMISAVSADSMIRGALPRARDGMGRFYVELTPPPHADGSGNRDSAAVVRVTAGTGRGDTIAWLSPLDITEVNSEQGRRFERRIFSGIDYWGVLADGSAWVARVFHNRVDWRTPDGQWIEGQPLPDRVLEVTRYDREMFVRNFPPELRSTAHQMPFAPIKPPFEDAFATADGEVWLVKSRAPADSAGLYHVVGRDGRLARNLRIPGDGRVVGANRDAAVVVERIPGGVRLLRYALPRAGSKASS